MKLKILSGVIVVLILAVITGNWIYGKNVAKKVDEQLKSKISNNELPVTVSYSSVDVNPLFSKVTLNDLKISAMGQEGVFTCEEVEFSISAKEALRMSEDPKIEELKSFKVQFNDIEFTPDGSDKGVTVENVTIDFDGHLAKTDFENITEIFPVEKQTLELSFSNLSVNNMIQTNQKTAAGELQKQLSNVDKGKFKLIYDPDSKDITVKDLLLSSNVLKTRSNATLNYTGNGISDFKMISAKMKTDYNFEPKDIHWGDGDNGADISLSKLSIAADISMNFEKQGLPEGTISFLTKGLKINSKGNAAFSLPLPGASFNKLDIEKFSVNYILVDDKLTISDTELKSSLIDAALNADLSIDENNKSNSVINSAKLVVNKLSPELEGVVSMLEGQSGKKLPRENNIITLEVSGTLNSPKIKGLEF